MVAIRDLIPPQLGLRRRIAHHAAFVRACLPNNPRGAQDVESWLSSVGGVAILATPRNPFKSNLPALAYAIERRGDRPPEQLRAILAFTQLVEPMRAKRYMEIVDLLNDTISVAGIGGYIGGDVAAARSAYPNIDVRHITSVEIIVPERHCSQVQALCVAKGFQPHRRLPELVDEHGARVILKSRFYRSGRSGMVDDLLADHPSGLSLLPLPLLFVCSCIASYPGGRESHARAMIDAALLTQLLTPEDWETVRRLKGAAAREPFRAVLRYLQQELGIKLIHDI